MKSPSGKMFPAMLDTGAAQRLAGWATIPGFNRMKRKLHSRIRQGQSPASNLAKLQTSFDPADTLRSLRAHRWSIYDAQYLVLIIVGIFALSVIEEPGPLAKTSLATLLMASLIIPITRQFFLPFLPALTWLVLFYACRYVIMIVIHVICDCRRWRLEEISVLIKNCRFIPSEWRPHIWVRVLPALENIIYGANISNIVSAHKHAVLDILAWLPYGVIHFAGPVIMSCLVFVFGAPGTLRVYARSFGYMNIIGVLIQLCFPCSPPCKLNCRFVIQTAVS